MYLITGAVMLVHVLVTRAVGEECPEQSIISVVKNYLVKEDPSKFYDGRYFNLWLRELDKGMSMASFSDYKHQEDGSIQETVTFVNLKGEVGIVADEILRKTSTIGEYDMTGDYSSSTPYYGKTYVFYADSNVIGYYGCQSVGSTWYLNIQVKSENKKLLLPEAGENDVKKSMKEAEKKVDIILEDFFKLKHAGIVRYDLNAL